MVIFRVQNYVGSDESTDVHVVDNVIIAIGSNVIFTDDVKTNFPGTKST